MLKVIAVLVVGLLGVLIWSSVSGLGDPPGPTAQAAQAAEEASTQAYAANDMRKDRHNVLIAASRGDMVSACKYAKALRDDAIVAKVPKMEGAAEHIIANDCYAD